MTLRAFFTRVGRPSLPVFLWLALSASHHTAIAAQPASGAQSVSAAQPQPPGTEEPKPPREGVDFHSVKVDQAIATTEAWIREHPNDARGYFVLARLHSIAWMCGDPAFGDTVAMAIPAKAGDISAPLVSPIAVFRKTPASNSPWKPADAAHFNESIRAFRKTIELDAKTPLYHLAFGWILEKAAENLWYFPEQGEPLSENERQQFAAAIARLGDRSFSVRDAADKELVAALPKDLELLREFKTDDQEIATRIDRMQRDYWRAYWIGQALDNYRAAFALSVQADLKTERITEPDRPISLLAANMILGMLHQYPEAARPDEKKTLSEAVEKLKKIPNPLAPRT